MGPRIAGIACTPSSTELEDAFFGPRQNTQQSPLRDRSSATQLVTAAADHTPAVASGVPADAELRTNIQDENVSREPFSLADEELFGDGLGAGFDPFDVEYEAAIQGGLIDQGMDFL